MQQHGKIFTKVAAAVMAGAFVLALTAFASFAASEFEGVWKVEDEKGNSFEITLSADGSAKATLVSGMTGTWKEEDGAALMTWNTGWTSKIRKEGDSYKNMAWDKDAPLSGPPTIVADVEKVN